MSRKTFVGSSEQTSVARDKKGLGFGGLGFRV